MKQRRTTRRPARRPNAAPGKRAENKERTRQAILRAALELFSRRGFHATTTRQIARRARIAEGTLFNYFRTKEDLALFFFEQTLERTMAWYEHETRLRRAALPERLFAIIQQHLELLGPNEDFIGAVYLRALQPASRLNPLSLDALAIQLRYLRFVRDILAEAEQEEELPRFGELGPHLFGLFHLAVITHWLQDASPGKGNTLAMLDRGLRVATAALKHGGWNW
jgi:AcrR family transcriptional regulator